MIDGHPLVRLGVREVLAGRLRGARAGSREEAVDLVRDIGGFDVAIVDMRWRQNGAEAVARRPRRRSGRCASPRPGWASSPTASAPSATSPAPPCRPAPAPTSPAPPAAELLRGPSTPPLAQESFVDPAVPPKGSRGKLTRRQREILQLLANGESTTVAARELGLSEETVKTHIKNALARLGARNRTHAVAIALRESPDRANAGARSSRGRGR